MLLGRVNITVMLSVRVGIVVDIVIVFLSTPHGVVLASICTHDACRRGGSPMGTHLPTGVDTISFAKSLKTQPSKQEQQESCALQGNSNGGRVALNVAVGLATMKCARVLDDGCRAMIGNGDGENVRSTIRVRYTPRVEAIAALKSFRWEAVMRRSSPSRYTPTTRLPSWAVVTFLTLLTRRPTTLEPGKCPFSERKACAAEMAASGVHFEQGVVTKSASPSATMRDIAMHTVDPYLGVHCP